MPALEVWMNGEHVGVWSASRSAVPIFKYDPQWALSPSARALSLSLPITAGSREHRGDVVANYFDNLLPDSVDIRKRLARHFETKSTDAFELLTAIGRDCVGAVQLLPEGMQPQGWDRIESDPLTEEQVERILKAVTWDAPLGLRQADSIGGDAQLRLSIAGAQEKTALLRIGRAWHRPRGATPTTHILKLPLGLVGNMRADLTESVENEWLCAQIVRELGLAVAATEMARFGTQKALVVQRFDRRWRGIATSTPDNARFVPPPRAWIARLPQEDMCQATGTAPARKYEADGGPSMSTCIRVLASSSLADTDRRDFVLAQLAFWMLAATDGHAKNVSIFHRRGGTFAMTPLYDVISAWPIIGKGPNHVSEHAAKLAMPLHSKNTHYKLRDIRAPLDDAGAALRGGRRVGADDRHGGWGRRRARSGAGPAAGRFSGARLDSGAAWNVAPGRPVFARSARVGKRRCIDMKTERMFGLPPLIGKQARLLVLGSFPGAASLRAQQYYAHPRNHFWPILSALWGLDLVGLPYAQRIEQTRRHGLAIWDIYSSCRREGSLDQAIEEAEFNDFSNLRRRAPGLRAVAHNGAESARAMRPVAALGFDVVRLPSTSPANASWSFDRKLAAWRDVFVACAIAT